MVTEKVKMGHEVKQSAAVLWLIRRIRRRIPAIILMTAVHMGQAVFGVWFALGTKAVIDCAVAGEAGPFYEACVRQGAVILGILLCLTVFRHLKEKLSAELDRDWKKQLLHGLLHGDYMEVSGYHSAELLNRMNNDVKTVDEGILTILPSVAGMSTRLIAAVAVLAALDPVFTLLIAVLGGLMIVVTGLLRRRLKDLHKRVSAQDGVVSGLLQETMEKLLLVQAMDVSDEVERRAGVMLGERYQMQRRRKNVSLLANTGVSVMSYGAAFLALVWCAGRVLAGTMSFGTLTAVTQLVSQLQSPFVGLSGVFPKYIAMVASAERLMELESIPAEPAAVVGVSGAAAVAGLTTSQLGDASGGGAGAVRDLYDRMTGIAGRGLCFTYDRDVILQDAEFTLPKGSFAVITGPSGTGKSTLLKLLLGIFPLSGGELYLEMTTSQLDDACGAADPCTPDSCIPIDRSTRRLFAYVPQGNLLFSGTIRENLTMVKPDATEEELQLAVHVSAMDEFLPDLPAGLDTLLGESGAGLSEGQAQRLAIARAVLGGAPILLLDECTSALDVDTEALVLSRLRSLPGKTCIAVTHRPAAIALCDWQLEIENGKIKRI